MKVDWYTKVILTIIAVCMVVIVIRGTDFIYPAHASPGGVVDVRIVSIDEGSGRWEALPVKINDTVEVNGSVSIDGSVHIYE